MFSILGRRSKLCDGITRREWLRVGGLAFAGLSLADVLRLRANDSSGTGRNKSVIMIWLRGGPSHIDSYDMKPNAPAEVRGEFRPIPTNVTGIQICEHMPRQARIMDKLAIVRGIRSNDLGDHTPHYIVTGFPDRGRRPAFGSIVSYLQPRADGLPRYVSLVYRAPGLYDNESPTYTGPAHRPFVPRGQGLPNMSLAQGISLDRLGERRHLLTQFDDLRRDLDHGNAFAGHDAFNARALEIITSPRAREAFDVNREPAHIHARYGKFCENFLMARRLVEAGVSVVTLKVGDWDTHEHNFRDMREQLPQLDQGFHALVTDLYDRGLENDVAVVMWGEFGRAPRISRGDGRDHWPEAGAAVLAGGGFRAGQTIGETDAQGGRSRGTPYTPGNVLASLYRHLGIDPAITIPDHNRRPMHVLDEREPVRELA
ncbi:MAG: DUF1501 domain-containing protein [Gemmataceae bacterium]|nr:DUF1501 domain-containing protein [Gemmataceae bacterium]